MSTPTGVSSRLGSLWTCRTVRSPSVGADVATRSIPIVFCWSGGKDSAHALRRLLDDDRYRVRSLVTTVHGAKQVSSVHELPLRLLWAQAEAIGVPLESVALAGPGLDDYAEVMEQTARRLRDEGVRAIAFGDLESSGALAYRNELFESSGLAVVEPLWGMTSQECMDDFLRSRIDALTVVVDASVLGREHLGAQLDRAFVDALPAGCDPCGELGEYHTFVADAPYFDHPVCFAARDSIYLERRIGTHDGLRTFGYWQLRLE